MDILEKARAILSSRQSAYLRTFNVESEDVKIVLKDLADFCRAHETTFHENERVHAVLEGRREVFLKIQKYLNLSPEKLWELYRKE